MSLNFGVWQTDLANLLMVPSSDPNFVTAQTDIINDVEGRMYRDIDPLATRVTNNAGAFSSANRSLALSTTSGTFLVVEEVSAISPATATSTSGSINQLVHVSREFLNLTYPSNSAVTGVPQFWSMVDNANIIVGPAPDAPYPAQIIGTIRPAQLSSNNSSNFLTQTLPDVYMAASCMFGAAYLKNFGAAQDDPKSGMTWEAVYQNRMQSALVEEQRKKHGGPGWTAKIPNPIATPPRV
jgi:hypothetical protein